MSKDFEEFKEALLEECQKAENVARLYEEFMSCTLTILVASDLEVLDALEFIRKDLEATKKHYESAEGFTHIEEAN